MNPPHNPDTANESATSKGSLLYQDLNNSLKNTANAQKDAIKAVPRKASTSYAEDTISEARRQSHPHFSAWRRAYEARSRYLAEQGLDLDPSSKPRRNSLGAQLEEQRTMNFDNFQ